MPPFVKGLLLLLLLLIYLNVYIVLYRTRANCTVIHVGVFCFKEQGGALGRCSRF